MYSRQSRGGQQDIPVELPRDYSGNAFSPFVRVQGTPVNVRTNEKNEGMTECESAACGPAEDDNVNTECDEVTEVEKCEPVQDCGTPSLGGIKSLLGGNIGLEELLLLGVIFLIFSDGELRDAELLICLLLILFI